MEDKRNNKTGIYAFIAILIVCVGVVIWARMSNNEDTNGSNLNSEEKKTMETMQFSKAEEVLKEGVDYKAVIKTNYGDITIDLLEKETPVAVNNFVFLAQQHYYDGVTFHRVHKGFVIQSGDRTGTGRGGPGYQFANEINQRGYSTYSVGMANAGPDTNGSQFFITTGTIAPLNIQALDNGGYVLFGEVTDGFEVVDAIENVDVDGERPISDIIISEVEILENS